MMAGLAGLKQRLNRTSHYTNSDQSEQTGPFKKRALKRQELNQSVSGIK